MVNLLLLPVDQVHRDSLESFLDLVAPQSKEKIFSDYESFSSRYQGVQLGASLVDLGLLEVRDLPGLLKPPSCSLIGLPSLEEIDSRQKEEEMRAELDRLFVEYNLKGAEKGLSFRYLTAQEIEELQKVQQENRDRGMDFPLNVLSFRMGKQSLEEIQQVYQEIIRENPSLRREGQAPEVKIGKGKDPFDVERDFPIEEEEEVMEEVMEVTPELSGEEVMALSEPPLPDIDLSPPQAPVPLGDMEDPFADVEPEASLEEMEPVGSLEIMEPVASLEEVEPVDSLEVMEPVAAFEEVEPVASLEEVEPSSVIEEKPIKKAPRTKVSPPKAPRLSAPEESSLPADQETRDLSLFKNLMAHFTKELSQTLSPEALAKEIAQILPQKDKKAKTGERVTINGKDYRVLTGEDLQAALKLAKPIRRSYIPTLKIDEKVVSHKIEILNCVIDWVDLHGITFEKDVDFKGTYFKDKVNLKGTGFMKKLLCRGTHFAGGLDVSESNFEGEVNFNGAQFDRYGSFRKNMFKKKAIFAKAKFQGGASFEHTEFNGEVSFSESFSNYRFTFIKTRFGSTAKFSNSIYKDMCDFSDSEFCDETNYIRVQFDGPVKFSRTRYRGPVNFKGTYFLKDVFFHDTEFGDKTDFGGVQGEGNVFFQGMKTLLTTSFIFSHVNISRMFLEREQVESHIHSHRMKDYDQARRDYGILKTNFREINSYSDEDWAYYMEKRMARFTRPAGIKNPVSTFRRFFEWFALDVGCGYGTKPINILFVSLMTIAIFGGLFLFMPKAFEGPAGMNSSDFGFFDALVTSFKAFTGAEVGEWHPKPIYPLVTLFVMFEAFLGIFITTVLVVTFSRKVIR